MATSTTNLNMTKPDYADDANIAVINANMDILDTEVGALKAKKTIMADMGTISALPVQKTVAGVSSDMKVCGFEIGTPSALASNITVTTTTNTVTVSGTIRSGSNTTLKIMVTNSTDVTGT